MNTYNAGDVPVERKLLYMVINDLSKGINTLNPILCTCHECFARCTHCIFSNGYKCFGILDLMRIPECINVVYLPFWQTCIYKWSSNVLRGWKPSSGLAKGWNFTFVAKLVSLMFVNGLLYLYLLKWGEWRVIELREPQWMISLGCCW